MIYWKLNNPLPFEGKDRLIDALRIIRLDDLTLDDVTIVYVEGWALTDKAGVVTEIRTIRPLQTWRWNDGSFKDILLSAPPAGQTLQAALLKTIYEKLAASKAEYAGALVMM